MLIFGKGINPGVTGTNVNLSNLTPDGQVQNMQHDYRQVFTTLLQDWLGADNTVLEAAMFDSYMKLPLLAGDFVVNPDCYLNTVGTFSPTNGSAPLSVFPNPARISTEVTFISTHPMAARLTVHSMSGQVTYAGNVKVQPGENFFYLDVMDMPVGNYVVRVEDRESGLAQVCKLVVVK
jgi:hypothetical protein